MAGVCGGGYFYFFVPSLIDISYNYLGRSTFLLFLLFGDRAFRSSFVVLVLSSILHAVSLSWSLDFSSSESLCRLLIACEPPLVPSTGACVM